MFKCSKKILLIGCLAALCLVLTGCKKKEEPQPVVKTQPLINQKPVKERPYATLNPTDDGHSIDLTIYDSAGAHLVEYELEYQAGSMLQGAFGRIDFSTESLPVTKNLLFGSCSKGKCKYDEGVSGGSLTLRYEGTDSFAVKGEFSYQNMTERQGVFASRDSKVSLDVGPKGLPANTYLVVANTLGLPGEVEGEIVAGPYGFFTPDAEKINNATLSWQTKQTPEGTKVYGWVDGDWQEFNQNLATEAGLISVSVDQLTTFVLVK